MIYYIGYYCGVNNTQNRNIRLAATNKMQYIMDVLTQENVKVRIISCSMTNDPRPYSSSFEKLTENASLVLFKTLGRKSLMTRAIDYFNAKIQLALYLLRNVKSNDILLVYHSPAYCKLISWMKKIKKFRLILELEEIYSDVSLDNNLRKKEDVIIKSADAFVLPTNMLNVAINNNCKPSVIIHGTYQVEVDRKCRYNDGKIHVVYAGTFDPRKGGAAAAAAAAEFLDERYHMHIIGFGNEAETQSIKSLVENISIKTKCTLTFDGLKSGEDYIRFIQSCQIGLSTQNPDAKFNDTSFPSKILSYLANGLRVVSIRVPVIEGSAIGNNIYYYDEQTPEEIAKAITAVNLDDEYDGRLKLIELDNDFREKILELVEKQS